MMFKTRAFALPHWSAQAARRLMLAALLLGATLAGAQPPSLIHYQGRLTDSSGNPITTNQTLIFSLWSGGSAATANSGTLLYKESMALTPGPGGVFDCDIGGGTPISGTFRPSDFNTANTIFIQVDAGSTTLLPRTRLTSVGYALVASQAASATYAAQVGKPRVTAVTDKTGGITVIGDLLQIDGAGLAGAKVTIGGAVAPVVSAADGRLVCQVPEGIPMGYNPVAILDAANGLASVTVAHINVHRLLVWVSYGFGSNPQLIIIDALTREIIKTYNPNISADSNVTRLQVAFANNGSLALIPSNNNNAVYALDLTANPLPSALLQYNISGMGRANSISVPPDNTLMAVSDVNGNYVYFVRLLQFAPPYTSTSSLFGAVTNTSQVPNINLLPGFRFPRGSAFIGDGLFVFCASSTTNLGVDDGLFVLRREPGTLNFRVNTQYYSSTTRVPGTYLKIGNRPFYIDVTRDLTRLYVMSRNAANLSLIYTAPEGLSGVQSTIGLGNKAWGVGVSPDGDTLFAADADVSSGIIDVVQAINASGGNFRMLGEIEDRVLDKRTNATYAFQLAALEPVEGRLLAVGTNTNRLVFFQRDGGVLTLINDPPLDLTIGGNLLRDTYELRFQP